MALWWKFHRVQRPSSLAIQAFSVLLETVAFLAIWCVSFSVTMTVFWHEHQWNSALNHVTGHAALSSVNDWQSGSHHRSNDQIPNDDTIS
jgi:uncharacterized membrane protein